MGTRNIKTILFVLVTITTSSCKAVEHKEKSVGFSITAVPFTDVTLADDFWAKRIETNRTVTIPFGFKKCEEEGRIRNFAKAGGLLEGQYEGKMPFDDTDVYKIIEGASYSLTIHPDKKLEKYIDETIEKIAAAQEEDGYLCTWKTLNPDGSQGPEETTITVLNVLINSLKPEQMPRGLEKFRLFNRLSKAFETSEISKVLEVEEADYNFLKQVIENNIPSVWAMNKHINQAIENFLIAKEE